MSDDAAARARAEETLEGWTRLQEERCDEGEWVQLRDLITAALTQHAAEAVGEQGMTFSEFSDANRARCEAPDGFHHRLENWSLSDWFLAVLGELGEAANVAKKLNRMRDGIPGNKESAEALRGKLRREIADTFIYLDLAAQAAGFRLVDVVAEVFDAKSQEIGYPVLLRARRPA